jgi:hypothetical protein
MGQVDGELTTAVPVMSACQIAWLAAQIGVEIGGHTHSHQFFELPGPCERRQQLRSCSDILEQVTGRKPVSFAFPFGDCDDAGRLAEYEDDLRAEGFESGRLTVKEPLTLEALSASRYRLPVTGDLAELSDSDVQCALATAAGRAHGPDQMVVHFYGHSSLLLKQGSDHISPRRLLCRLSVLTRAHEDYQPERVWFCTQGEIVAAAMAAGGAAPSMEEC